MTPWLLICTDRYYTIYTSYIYTNCSILGIHFSLLSKGLEFINKGSSKIEVTLNYKQIFNLLFAFVWCWYIWTQMQFRRSTIWSWVFISNIGQTLVEISDELFVCGIHHWYTIIDNCTSEKIFRILSKHDNLHFAKWKFCKWYHASQICRTWNNTQ